MRTSATFSRAFPQLQSSRQLQWQSGASSADIRCQAEAEWQVARPPVADRKGRLSLQFSSLFPFNIILQKEACKWKRSRQRNTRLPFNKTLIIFERDKPSATGIPFARFVRLSLVEHLAFPSCRYRYLVFLMSVCRADMRWGMRWEWLRGGLASLNYRHLFFLQWTRRHGFTILGPDNFSLTPTIVTKAVDNTQIAIFQHLPPRSSFFFLLSFLFISF